MYTVLPFQIANIMPAGYHLLTEIYINNKKARVIVDTGASSSVFDYNGMKKFTRAKHEVSKIKSASIHKKLFDTSFVVIKKMKLNKLVIENYKAVCIDLSNVKKQYKSMGLPTVEGILGNDILYLQNAVIDFQKKQIRLLAKSNFQEVHIPHM